MVTGAVFAEYTIVFFTVCIISTPALLFCHQFPSLSRTLYLSLSLSFPHSLSVSLSHSLSLSVSLSLTRYVCLPYNFMVHRKGRIRGILESRLSYLLPGTSTVGLYQQDARTVRSEMYLLTSFVLMIMRESRTKCQRTKCQGTKCQRTK